MNSSALAEEFSASKALPNYKNSYEEARALFLSNVEALKASEPELQLHSLTIPTKTKETLVTDAIYLPPKSGKKERLLILTSGVHGIEGFTGSALQNLFISENFWQLRDENLGILIVHAVNPYGFKFERRVSENNVDLNRNFDISKDLFAIKNDGYEKISYMLNPTEAANAGFWDRMKFYVTCIEAIWKYSMDSLRRAILRGQYEEAEGIYFGGTDFEPQKELLEKEINSAAAGYRQVLLIDLHTGYGRRGHLHLFADRSPDINAVYLGKIFGGYELDYGKKEDFYETTGGFVVFGGKLLRPAIEKNQTRYAGMTFEFGTLDSQKTLGSLDSLYRMVRENQKFQHGAQSKQESEEIQRLFHEMFYPSDLEWRTSVAKQFHSVLTMTLKNQKALK